MWMYFNAAFGFFTMRTSNRGCHILGKPVSKVIPDLYAFIILEIEFVDGILMRK